MKQQIIRVIKILQILSSGKKVTISELSEHFDRKVTARTLQRDMRALLEADIPLIYEKINNNKNIWYVNPRFLKYIPRLIGINEYLAAVFLRQNLTVFNHTVLEKDINSLIEKINQFIPENIIMAPTGNIENNLYDNYIIGMFDYSSYTNLINEIIQAIIDKKKCKIVYENIETKNPKTYTIEPQRIIYYKGCLYILVYYRQRKTYLTLAIQRIQKLLILNEIFVPDQEFDSKKFRINRFGMFNAKPIMVKLKFSKEICHYIEGRIWHPSQKISLDSHQNLILQLKVGITPELVSWIMSWHEYVKVISPKTLIEQILNSADKIKNNYINTT